MEGKREGWGEGGGTGVEGNGRREDGRGGGELLVVGEEGVVMLYDMKTLGQAGGEGGRREGGRDGGRRGQTAGINSM